MRTSSLLSGVFFALLLSLRFSFNQAETYTVDTLSSLVSALNRTNGLVSTQRSEIQVVSARLLLLNDSLIINTSLTLRGPESGLVTFDCQGNLISALSIFSGNVLIENFRFVNCFKAAVFINSTNAGPTAIRNCAFEHNLGPLGGAVVAYSMNSSLEVVGCNFVGNMVSDSSVWPTFPAQQQVNALDRRTGAALSWFNAAPGSLTITGCVFNGNAFDISVPDAPASHAVFAWCQPGGGICNTTISESRFEENWAGAIYLICDVNLECNYDVSTSVLYGSGIPLLPYMGYPLSNPPQPDAPFTMYFSYKSALQVETNFGSNSIVTFSNSLVYANQNGGCRVRALGFAHSTFSGNNLTVESNTFFYPNVWRTGGAFRADGLDAVLFTNATFLNNTYTAVYFNYVGQFLDSGVQAVTSFTDCTLHANSADPLEMPASPARAGSSQGGALWVLGGSLAISILRCDVRDNWGAWSGGAIMVVQDRFFNGYHTDLNVADSVFVNNTGVYGGAVNSRQVDNYIIDRSQFINNTAVFGGALHVSFAGRVEFTSVNFTGNSGYLEGGAIVIARCSQAVLRYIDFNNNYLSITLDSQLAYVSPAQRSLIDVSALSQQLGSFHGGGASISYTIINLHYSNFTNNTADRGGGLSILYGEVALIACNYRNNLGRGLGGGFLVEAAYITSTFTTFTGNRAVTGGAINVVLSYMGSVPGSSNVVAPYLSNTNFTGNSATYAAGLNTALGTQSTYADAVTSGCGVGGGGAVCWRLNSNVEIINATFTGNTATFGGGLYVQELAAGVVCNSTGPCITAKLSNCEFKYNTAVDGAAGAVYWQFSNFMDITCLNSSKILPVPNLLGAPYSAVVANRSLPCASWIGNTVVNGYGPTVGSGPVYLATNKTVVPFYASDSSLTVVLQVLDYYGQSANYLQDPYTPNVTVTCSQTNDEEDIDVGGQLKVEALDGLAVYTNLKVRAVPGEYNISFHGMYFGRPMTNAPEVLVVVRDCQLNQYASPDNTTCLNCRTGSYTFSPVALSCEVCPEGATCSTAPPTKDDPVGIGGILVPELNFWNSNPFSEQVHRCPNAQACSYDGRDGLNTTLTTLQSCLEFLGDYRILNESRQIVLGGLQDCLADQYDLTMVINTTLQAMYSDALCQTGYYGVLCGQCQDGFGQTGRAKCSKCYSIGLNTFFYVLVSLVTFLFLLITLRSTVLDADAIEVRLARSRALTVTPSLSADISKEIANESIDTRISPSMPIREKMSRSNSKNNPSILRRIQSRAGAVKNAIMRTTSPQKETTPAMNGDSAPRFSIGDSDRGTPLSDRPLILSSPMDSRMSTMDHRESGDSKAALERNPLAGASFASDRSGRTDFSKMRASMVAATRVIPEDNTQVSACIKITVSYFQVLTILRNVPIAWPGAFTSLSNAFSQVTAVPSSAISLDCSLTYLDNFQKALARILITILAPFYVTLALTLFWMIRGLFLRKNPPEGFTDYKSYVKQHFAVTSITCIFYFYPSVCNILLSIFLCERVDGDTSNELAVEAGLVTGQYWYLDFGQECYTGKHNVVVYALGVPGLILFALGVPVSMLVFLWRHLSHFGEEGFKHYYRFMYMEYEPKFFYWESVVMARKLLLLMVVVFMNSANVSNNNGILQLLVAQAVLLGSLFLQLWLEPFVLRRMDRLEICQLSVLSMSLYIVMYFTANDLSEGVQLALSILVVMINISLVVWMAVVIIKEATQGLLHKMGLPPKEVRKMTHEQIRDVLLKKFDHMPWLASMLAKLVHSGVTVYTGVSQLPRSFTESVIASRFVSQLRSRVSARSELRASVRSRLAASSAPAATTAGANGSSDAPRPKGWQIVRDRLQLSVNEPAADNNGPSGQQSSSRSSNSFKVAHKAERLQAIAELRRLASGGEQMSNGYAHSQCELSDASAPSLAQDVVLVLGADASGSRGPQYQSSQMRSSAILASASGSDRATEVQAHALNFEDSDLDSQAGDPDGSVTGDVPRWSGSGAALRAPGSGSATTGGLPSSSSRS